MKVYLNSIEKAKRFNLVASQQEYDIYLASGKFVVDGKSIMGIFSLDLSNPVDIIIEPEQTDLQEVKNTFKEFFSL